MRGRSQREVSVGCPELSLGEISQSGCVGGPPMETVWVSVWRLLVRVPRLLTVLPLTREGHKDSPLLVSCCSVGVPLCHFSQQVSWGSAPPSPSTHLMVPLRTRQPPGSGPCSVLSSPELWRSPCGLGSSPSLRPWLSPHHCAHRDAVQRQD